MKRFRLTANKTKLVALLRYLGYSPTVRKSHFVKLYRCWWLDWEETSGFYEAFLDSCCGRAFIRIQKHTDAPSYRDLSIDELRRFNLLEEIV